MGSLVEKSKPMGFIDLGGTCFVERNLVITLNPQGLIMARLVVSK